MQVPVVEIVTPGYVKVIENEGMVKPDGTKGDLIIEFNVLFPKSLNAHQKKVGNSCKFTCRTPG